MLRTTTRYTTTEHPTIESMPNKRGVIGASFCLLKSPEIWVTSSPSSPASSHFTFPTSCNTFNKMRNRWILRNKIIGSSGNKPKRRHFTLYELYAATFEHFIDNFSRQSYFIDHLDGYKVVSIFKEEHIVIQDLVVELNLQKGTDAIQ
jgi:hypothetical protein